MMNEKENIEDIRKLQLVQLEILIEFDRICRANNIPYQLFSGTLLGAVRHKGFIPWDDDVDVCMLRKDYIKFLAICKNQLDKRYFLQTYETDKEYIHLFARIRKNNTLLLQEAWEGIDMHHGIFIDVFPMDNILPGQISGKIQYLLLYFSKLVKKMKHKKYCLNSDRVYKTCIKVFFHYVLKPIRMQSFNRIQSKIICMFQNKSTTYSTCLTDGGKETYHKYMMKNNDFYNTTQLEFEEHLFPVPSNYHEILTNIFGDYMTPPPVEQQKPHHGIIDINFNTEE